MSLYKNYYIIAGYDLTGYATDKYDDWKWTPEGERYLCCQSKGNIQLFDDPCNGEHFCLGYVLAHGDQYDFPKTVVSISTFTRQQPYVVDKLKQLISNGVVDKSVLDNLKYEMIAFEECN